MPLNIIIIIIAITAGILIWIYQKTKYDYLGIFGYSEERKNVFLKISATGHYVLNETKIPEHPTQRAIFKIEEGIYSKQANSLDLCPEKCVCYFYKNVGKLVQNNYYQQVQYKTANYKLLYTKHGLALNGYIFHKFSRGKIVSVKQFLKNKHK